MFDPFYQSKLMKAYNGVKDTVLPPLKELDSIDELKKLAGIDKVSYGETTSQYATNLATIQRERNIRPGDPEWFRLYFSKPLLTGEKPYE